MVMIFKSEKARKFLLEHGIVVSFRKNRRKTNLGKDWLTDKRGGKKIGDILVIELGEFEVEKLEPFVSISGFKNLQEWKDEIQKLNNKSVSKGWLYLVNLLNHKVETKEVKYPCPKCGNYEKPYMYNSKGYALMLCSKCKCQYQTSTSVSANFRKFCSRIAKKPNRSPTYYSSSERAVKLYLERKGLIEGLDFFHNARVKATNGSGKKVYYWFDFVLPKLNLVIEVDPEVWHRLWGREKSDQAKRKFIESLKGWKLISLNSKDIQKLNRQKTPSKRTKNCKLLDKIVGSKDGKES